jgi:protease-4
MRKILAKLVTITGICTVSIILIICLVGVVLLVIEGRVPKKTILEINFEGDFVECLPDDPVTKTIFGNTPKMRDVVDALEKASEDDRVVGFIAKIGDIKLGLARVQEIRDAVAAFRGKGKAAVAYAETFGELSPGNDAYYLATAFEKIYLQPTGEVGLTGLIEEEPFIRGVLDKLGIIPRYDHRQEYKTFKNMFTEKKYTAAHRKASQKIMASCFSQIVKGITESRHLSKDEVKSLINRGPFYGKEALEAKLVDGLLYRDQVYQNMRENAGKEAKHLYLSEYLKRAGRPHTKGKTVALIYGVGPVHRGKSTYDPLYDSGTMGSETVTTAFRSAIDDENVKAILFRIDSPGGSAVASDAIRRETIRAKKAGKPVIVSMGDVAGSGGYFVAMAADKIVAQPGTITGSIGVVAGKMITSGFWDKIGLSWDSVHTSANAGMWSEMQDYTPGQWNRLQAFLNTVYDDFTQKVAAGRNLPLKKVLSVAKGRIWTGKDAKALGLIDKFGGLTTALRLAKTAIGVSKDEEIHLMVFPKEKSLLQLLSVKEPESSQEEMIAVTTRHTLERLQPVFGLIDELGITNNYGVLTMQKTAARQ